MAPIRAKIGLKWMRNGGNKNYRFVSFRSVPNQRGIENAKKKAKKLKNTIVASFQAEILWKMPRKREIKNYRFVPFPPDA